MSDEKFHGFAQSTWVTSDFVDPAPVCCWFLEPRCTSIGLRVLDRLDHYIFFSMVSQWILPSQLVFPTVMDADFYKGIIDVVGKAPDTKLHPQLSIGQCTNMVSFTLVHSLLQLVMCTLAREMTPSPNNSKLSSSARHLVQRRPSGFANFGGDVRLSNSGDVDPLHIQTLQHE